MVGRGVGRYWGSPRGGPLADSEPPDVAGATLTTTTSSTTPSTPTRILTVRWYGHLLVLRIQASTTYASNILQVGHSRDFYIALACFYSGGCCPDSWVISRCPVQGVSKSSLKELGLHAGGDRLVVDVRYQVLSRSLWKKSLQMKLQFPP